MHSLRLALQAARPSQFRDSKSHRLEVRQRRRIIAQVAEGGSSGDGGGELRASAVQTSQAFAALRATHAGDNIAAMLANDAPVPSVAACLEADDIHARFIDAMLLHTVSRRPYCSRRVAIGCMLDNTLTTGTGEPH